jgi:hypothetical protein
MKEWLDHAVRLSHEPHDLWVQGKKILRQRRVVFSDMTLPELDIESIGFHTGKSSRLIKLYRHEESIEVARTLWDKRVATGKYGSVGFTCYNHFVKIGVTHPFGPCIQAVTLTYLPSTRQASVDVFYRTTEFYKKFPADLILFRDCLLPSFDFSRAPIATTTFHFANITLHPMYYSNLFPLMDDPVSELERVKKSDPAFHGRIVKWTWRYFFGKTHTFNQAFRTANAVKGRLTDDEIRDEIEDYLKREHQ